MDKKTLLAHLDSQTTVLSLPQSLSEMLHAVDDPDFSAEQLAEIILKDPGLTSRILQLANSPFYRHAREIATVQQAVQLLGMTTVRCLALSASIFNPAHFQKVTGLDVRQFFTVILTVAAASQHIAARTNGVAAEESLVAGLLHEIGTMYLLHHYPDEYREVLNGGLRVWPRTEAERKVFGADHCEIGYHLARKWNLPEPICQAIRDHLAESSDSGNRLTDIVHLASVLTHDIVESNPEEEQGRLDRAYAAARRLGIGEEEVHDIVSQMPSWTLAFAEYLGVDVGDVQEMLSKANRKLWQVYLLMDTLFREREQLNEKVLKQERLQAAIEVRDIAHATLSHYLNNAVMSIYGRSQLLRMKLDRGKTDEVLEKLPACLDIIDQSVKKIVAVVYELKNLSLQDDVEFLSRSNAVNIDDRIRERLAQMEKDSGLILPEEVEEVMAQY